MVSADDRRTTAAAAGFSDAHRRMAAAAGRGLHSSTVQLKFSRFWHKSTP
jgi:hypothetical protein